ncbi:MAG: M28 family peptidase, partial [Candidatus Pacearchaeota archaeon]
MNKDFLLKKYLENISIPRAIGTKGNTETKKKLISFCKSFLPEKNIFIDKFRFTNKAEKISLLIFSIVVSLLFCALWLSLYYLLKVYFFIAIILLFGFIFLFFNYWLEIFNFIGSFGKIKCGSIIVKVTNSVSDNRLLVTAHRDSLSSRPRGEIYFKLFNLLFFYMPVSLGLLGIILINVYLPPFFTNFLLFLFGIYLFSLLFFVLFTSFGNESPGAYDNGTGVAILMALIKKYAGKKLPLQLWVAFLDCEEAGYGGSYSLAKKLNKDFFVLNLDGIGSGDLELAYADGPFKSKTSKFLNS